VNTSQLQHTKDLPPIEPKDRREMKDILLAGLAVSIMGKLAANTNMYKDSAIVRKRVIATHTRLKTKYPHAVSTYSQATAIFERLAERLLETQDDLTLMQAFNYIDDLVVGKATITVNIQANGQ